MNFLLKALIYAVLFCGFVSNPISAETNGKKKIDTQVVTTKYKKSKRVKIRIPSNKEFKVIGISAWDQARKNGFEFYPSGYPGTRDGAGITWDMKCLFGNKWKDIAGVQMVGGVNMLISADKHGGNDCYANFYFFAGKKLKLGWKVKSIKFTGSYQWTNNKWRSNTNKIETMVKVTQSRNQNNASRAMLKEVILTGPSNGKWQDAFDVN